MKTSLKWDASYITHQLANVGVKFDANETLAFAEQLKSVFAEVYRVEYPALKGRTIVPSAGGVNPGAKTWAYRQVEGFGKAKIVDDYATDFPNSDLKGTETAGVIRSLGSSYQYDIMDIRHAALLGFPLEAERANLARETIETLLDQLIAYGDTATGLVGFTNAPNISAVTKGSQASGTTWATATNDEILLDLLALTKSVYVNTLGTHTANTIAIDTVGYARLAYSKLNQYSDQSVLQFVQANLPGITQIIPWARLDTAGASSKARVMAFEQNPRNFGLVIPQEFEQVPPQARGLAFVVNCHLRTGGVKMPFPKSVSYMDGTEP